MKRIIYDEELVKMRENVILMSQNSINMFEQCLNLFSDARSISIQKSEEMKSQQEDIEIEIEKTVTRLITLQQPVAKDTREIICAIRIATNWVKISSHVADIVHGLLPLTDCGSEKLKLNHEEWEMLRQIKDAAERMLKGASDAYITRNADQAVLTAETDDEIDNIY